MDIEEFFVIISDAHIGWGLSSGFEDTIKLITKMRPRPSFVLNLGDMGHRNDREKNSKKYLEMILPLKEHKIPIHHLAGNHDVGNEPKTENCEWFRSNFGDLYFSLVEGRNKDVGIIALETNMMNKPNESTNSILSSQMNWVQKELDEFSKKMKVIIPVTHTSLFLTYYSTPSHFVVPSERAEELHKLFTKTEKVKTVFSGHYHMNDSVKKGEIEVSHNLILYCTSDPKTKRSKRQV